MRPVIPVAAVAPVRYRKLNHPWFVLASFVVIGLFVLVVGVACGGSSSSDSVCPPSTNAPFGSSPAWSPEGRKLAFERFDRGKWRIYVMSVDGSGLRQLGPASTPSATIWWTVYLTAGAWSPDGRKITFRAGTFGGISVINADGSNQRQLTGTPGWDDAPAWSPDGKRIAFRRTPYGSAGSQIYVMNADGSNQHQLMGTPALVAVAGGPTWSPHGRKIAFAGGNAQIIVVNADGRRQRQLTWPGMGRDDSDLAWSPNGAKIAFARGTSDGLAWIDVINADGSGLRQLTTSIFVNGLINVTACNQDGHPAWSPDGSQIAFDRLNTNDRNPQLYVMNADGGNQRPLTK